MKASIETAEKGMWLMKEKLQAGMTEEEVIDLMIAEQENADYNTLAGILFGLGFLLVLISFGARRKKGNPTKNVEKKAE